MKHSKFILGATGLFLAIAGALATKASNHYASVTLYTNGSGVCTKYHSHVCGGGGNNACVTGNANGRTAACNNTVKTGGTAF